MRRPAGRAGFTLAEVAVAAVLLQLGLLTTLATLHLAAHATRRADGIERGVVLAEGLLDSLAAAPAPVPGGWRSGAFEAEWFVRGGDVAVEVRVGPDTLRFVAAAAGRRR